MSNIVQSARPCRGVLVSWCDPLRSVHTSSDEPYLMVRLACYVGLHSRHLSTPLARTEIGVSRQGACVKFCRSRSGLLSLHASPFALHVCRNPTHIPLPHTHTIHHKRCTIVRTTNTRFPTLPLVPPRSYYVGSFARFLHCFLGKVAYYRNWRIPTPTLCWACTTRTKRRRSRICPFVSASFSNAKTFLE